MSRSLSEIAEAFWTFQCDEEPLTAIQAGLRVQDDTVFRAGVADHERRARLASSFLTELAASPVNEWTSRMVTTHSLLTRELTHLISLVETGAHLRPSVFPFGADMAAFRLGHVSTLFDSASVTAYAERVRAVPRAIGGFIETLRAGALAGVRLPRPVLIRAIAQARALSGLPADVHPLLDPFRRCRLGGDLIRGAEQEVRDFIAKEVAACLVAYADVLEHELLARASEELEVDEEAEARYRLAIDFYATVNDSPAAIHAFGLGDVERLSEEMIEVAALAGFAGDLVALRRHVANDAGQIAASADALRERFESLCKRIDARVPEWIGHLPRSTYGVRSIPLAIAHGMPPAYAQPNPADGSAAGTLWVTSIPDRLPAYLHVAMALHEGWPGHLLHVALIQEQSDLPAFLRYGATRYSACLEGWALYCEWLGESMGVYETPLERFGRLDMEMWRACRLVVDTGLHARGWSRERAVTFMRDHLSLPLATIEAEVDRYMGWPGQALSYQLGNIAFRRMRAKAEEILGDDFDHRAFHDDLMAAGPVTLPLLESMVRRRTEERQSACRS